MALLRLIPLVFFIVVTVFSGRAFGGPKNQNAVARKEDIPYIKCGVCEQLSQQLHRQVTEKRKKVAPQKLSEYQIIEVAENICSLKKHEGDWLLHLDIVEDGDKLKLVEQEEEGECNTECKTIERACQEVIGYHDTDVAEFLFKSESQNSALSKFLCNDLTKACSNKPPPVPKDRAPGEPFVPKSSKEAEMEKMLRSMSDMPGAPNMKMYSKDDIMNMQNFGGDDEDEDDEDDNPIASTFANTKRYVQSGKSDWKKDLVSKAQSTLISLKNQSNRAILSAKRSLRTISNKIRKWYKGSKPGSKSKKSSKIEL
ncbi:hypothetical protein SUGI_0246960 [Cryptomeria japonica]|uniref:uncharacterized protein LOC131035952 n=1 Tax=Cryptomeria japonica TaxID=3369 RepID=UPI002408BA8C|nr:uncharacterized protein LOC131035952 [Cryptomeria japonica]GLJ15110.1 hypothetical protein SUGI_0246960 [Cryptomeria japonica]